jgi:Xaa-Pro aminopeptidase
MMAELLGQHGLAQARIGVDSAGGLMAQVPGILRDVELRQIEREMRELRLVKTDDELDLIRQAAALSDWGQERYRENIRPGRVVQELDFSMAAAMADEAARRFDGGNVEFYCHSESGPSSAAPHGSGARTGSRVQEGDGIVNIVIVRVNGLVVENERTWFCGTPSAEQVRAFTAATEAQQAAIEQMVTGNSLAVIDAAALAIIEKAGYGNNVIHRTGHGIGIAGHEFPDDMAFNPRPLMKNEVYSAEPGIYIFGLGGFRHDDTVFIGDTPEVVTKAPKDIESQTVRQR